MKDILVRNIQPDDLRQTIAVIQTSHRESFKDLYPRELIESFCEKYEMENFLKRVEEIEYFVAEEEETRTILGVIGLKGKALRTFFVHPRHQGKGIGRKLYECIEKEARRRGLDEIVLEGSPLGEPIYAHFGFKKIKKIQKKRAGIPYTDTYMVKKLE